NYYLLFNPNSVDISVMATYFLSGGESFMIPYGIKANQRLTIEASKDPRLAGRDFSVTFDTMSAALPIVAERAMYWNRDSWVGGHASIGAKSLATEWHFAEGLAIPRYETYYTVLNPHATWTTLSARYFIQGRTVPFTRTYNIPPLSRYTIQLKNPYDTDQYVGGGTGEAGDVSASFTSSQPTIIERSMYWGGIWVNWVEGSNVVGVNAPATEWHLPEGTLAPGFESYVLISNPGDVATRVTLRLYLDGDGGRISKYVDVPPRTRVSLDLNGGVLEAVDQATILNRSFSVSVSSPSPVIVEHAIYRSLVPGTFWWRTGGASFGITEQ
ncbi:MAG: hypothetical protein KJ061_12035, partial [Vicinamibacteraceae bacterium]|nr:hypothetical protein [Vicinamibacteraceae bacterium]